MDTQPIVRTAGEGDLGIMVDSLSDGFANDPMLNWVFPKTELYPHFFYLLIKDVYLPRGLVHIEQEGRAAALWLPPEERYEIAPRLGLLRFGLRLARENSLRTVWRLHRQGSIFNKYYPAEPHYYLQFIGCRHSDQGQGIGSALLKAGLRVCDEHGMPAYLECSNARNVPLYERHGFVIKASQQVGKNGPTAWFMWRDSR